MTEAVTVAAGILDFSRHYFGSLNKPAIKLLGLFCHHYSTCSMSRWILVNSPGVAGWPGTSNSVDICETLEDWTTDLSFISDSDEEDDVLLVRNSVKNM